MTQQQALATLDKHALVGLGKYGDWMSERIAAVIGTKFHHRNQDGSSFVPCIVSSTTHISANPRYPWYHLVVVDPQALWHFTRDQLTDEARVLDALSVEVGRPVRAIRTVPTPHGPRHGVAYVVILKNAQIEPPQVQVNKFDLKTNFDISSIPAGQYMIPIGRTADGDLWRPLAHLLHLLVVGESGSGKSNFLKVTLIALTRQVKPTGLRLAIISPKRAEFAAFSGLPHLWRSDGWTGEIAATADEADRLVLSLRQEYDRRDILFARAGVTNLDDWNARAEPAQRLPRILLLADEVLDLTLMATRGSRMMAHLTSLTSVARSHGFHIFLGTSKPRFDVLPTTLTGNIDNRVCFRVATSDAAHLVKCPGAENIPAESRGRGIARLDGKLSHFQAFLVGAPQADPSNSIPIHVDDTPRLSDVERKLVGWATEHAGYLSLADIQSVAQLGPAQARRLAEDWRARGWLSKDPHARNKSKVTDKLISLSVC